MPFMFENLDVYQKAIAFADEISTLSENFSKGNYYLTDHLNRAALSIATNVAEGNGRYGKADRKNFFRISRGSAFECVPILELRPYKLVKEYPKNETWDGLLEWEYAKKLAALLKKEKREFFVIALWTQAMGILPKLAIVKKAPE